MVCAMNGITASQLRQDVYRLIDHVLETGEPLEIVRNGRRLHLTADAPVDLVARITPIPGLINGDPDELVSLDWSHEWDPDGSRSA